MIAEYDGSGTLLRKFIYGPGIDEPIQGLSPQGTVPEWYYHFDGLGSVTALTDSNGNLAESYTYDIYGRLTSAESAVGNPYYFTGRRYDSETGLYHYRSRAYDPAIGRFLQTDPLEIDYENKYTYCYNNPANWIDSYGLFVFPIPLPFPGIGPDVIIKPTPEELGDIGEKTPTDLGEKEEEPEVVKPEDDSEERDLTPPKPGENANPKQGTKEEKKPSKEGEGVKEKEPEVYRGIILTKKGKVKQWLRILILIWKLLVGEDDDGNKPPPFIRNNRPKIERMIDPQKDLHLPKSYYGGR